MYLIDSRVGHGFSAFCEHANSMCELRKCLDFSPFWSVMLYILLQKKNSLSNLAGVLSRLFSVCVKRIRIFVRFYKVFNAITIHSQLQHILPRSAEIPHWPCQIRTELYYLGRMYLFIYDSQCIGYFIVQVLKLLWLAGCAYTIHWEAIPSGCTNPALSNIIMTLQSIYLV